MLRMRSSFPSVHPTTRARHYKAAHRTIIELAHFHAMLLYDYDNAASDSYAYEDDIAECERGLAVSRICCSTAFLPLPSSSTVMLLPSSRSRGRLRRPCGAGSASTG
jgi:hypothetical protein